MDLNHGMPFAPQKMTIKAEAVQEKKIVKDRFTVAQKISQIKDYLITKKRFKFTDMFEEAHTKSEVIYTFLVLLELLNSLDGVFCE
jgi:chromatin segregation and condensation protein Rec8/ScpA/Scc1 (kleisin family)